MPEEHTRSPLWMPVLETERLLIRPYTPDDLPARQRLDAAMGLHLPEEQQRRWLEWSALNHEHLARLVQPPYGDRAVVLREDEVLIGTAGLVPSLGPFDRLPSFRRNLLVVDEQLFRPEVGLYWALDPTHRGRGYATEAARALIDYGFERLRLQRIVATTEYQNEASQAVMRRLGMFVERNPHPEPPWFQVVGVLENPRLTRP
jgi:ribosomal-protein-alanine N-acetyltransferase